MNARGYGLLTPMVLVTLFLVVFWCSDAGQGPPRLHKAFADNQIETLKDGGSQYDSAGANHTKPEQDSSQEATDMTYTGLQDFIARNTGASGLFTSVLVNEAYIDMAKNWKLNMEDVMPSLKLTVIAIDPVAFAALKDMLPTYLDEEYYEKLQAADGSAGHGWGASAGTGGEAVIGSPKHTLMQRVKFDVMSTALKMGKDVFFCEADVLWKKPFPFDSISSEVDFCARVDPPPGQSPMMDLGILYFRSTNHTIAFMDRMDEVMKEDGIWDMHAVSTILSLENAEEMSHFKPMYDLQNLCPGHGQCNHPKEKFKEPIGLRAKLLLPNDGFTVSPFLMNLPFPFDATALHFGGYGGMRNKVYDMKEHGYWYLDEGQYYSSESRKYIRLMPTRETCTDHDDKLNIGTALKMGKILDRTVIMPRIYCRGQGSEFRNGLCIITMRASGGHHWTLQDTFYEFPDLRASSFLECGLVPENVKRGVKKVDIQGSRDCSSSFSVGDFQVYVPAKGLATEDEIRSWFGNEASPVLEFKDLADRFQGFQDPAMEAEFNEKLKRADLVN